jgi:hypothetical protein
MALHPRPCVADELREVGMLNALDRVRDRQRLHERGQRKEQQPGDLSDDGSPHTRDARVEVR